MRGTGLKGVRHFFVSNPYRPSPLGFRHAPRLYHHRRADGYRYSEYYWRHENSREDEWRRRALSAMWCQGAWDRSFLPQLWNKTVVELIRIKIWMWKERNDASLRPLETICNLDYLSNMMSTSLTTSAVFTSPSLLMSPKALLLLGVVELLLIR